MRPAEAQYEDGILRLAEPLGLPPGERVVVVVMRRPSPDRWDLERLARSPDEDEALADVWLDDWSAELLKAELFKEDQ